MIQTIIILKKKKKRVVNDQKCRYNVFKKSFYKQLYFRNKKTLLTHFHYSFIVVTFYYCALVFV